MTMEYREVIEALERNERKTKAVEELLEQDYKVELTDKYGKKESYEKTEEDDG